ncbi:unnamed protein product [Prorocentrum cordatum]|uniref:Uncharacterized protein n=1 Tax=Prorocentrum cordatum TaxID=2364126 RepID=A0ABN9TWN1_9DINO|nr:unnamed protein product [Polarella glacialis]
MGRGGGDKGAHGGACGQGKDKSGSFVACTHCRYRWNFKSNHWCYQCCSPLVPYPSADKKPAGQWTFGPPAVASSPFADAAAGAAAAPPPGSKGPPVPKRGAKGGQANRRPWVWHGPGWYPHGGGPPPAPEAEAAPAADPLAALRAELGDCAELEAIAARRDAAKTQQPEPAPRRPPLLEEEESTKGIACRRAQAWLETCAARVVEGEAWLAAAKAAEDDAVAAAHQAQLDWEEACKKQLPSPPLEGEEDKGQAPAASAINVSTLVDEGTLQIVDGPLFNMEGLEIDSGDKDEWNRIKAELAASVQEKVQQALGPAAEQIVKLRDEAKQLHARMQVWLRNPQVLVEEGDAAHFMALGVEYVADWLAHPEFRHFIDDAILIAGHDNADTVQMDLARDICAAAWRAKKHIRLNYHSCLQRLELTDHEAWEQELARHGETMATAIELFDERPPPPRRQADTSIEFVVEPPFCGRCQCGSVVDDVHVCASFLGFSDCDLGVVFLTPGVPAFDEGYHDPFDDLDQGRQANPNSTRQKQLEAQRLAPGPPPAVGRPGAQGWPGPAGGALVQQVRHGPSDGRPGRLQHFRFGCDRAKGRFYYRFHKLIGKWNWRKYTERYMAPRALENRQRWIPSANARYTVARKAKEWLWLLPKGLAAATTPDEVLEVWIRFRHKHPKKTYHYFKFLKRLVDVGGCDVSDWRLKFATSRMRNIHRKVLNLPRLAKLYGQLRATSELEHLSRFIYKMLHKYEPSQLVVAASAFGEARLQDRRLFSEVARLLAPRLETLSPTDLVRLAQAFASAEVCHYTLLTQVSGQAQVRVQQASAGTAPPGSCPTFPQLTELAEAFARLKLQDYSFFGMCSLQARQLLLEGLPGPTPPALARLCSACSRLKIHEVRLYESVLAHVSDHWYDYPAASLALIGAAVAPTLPQEPPPVAEVYGKMQDVIVSDVDRLQLRGVEWAAKFMAAVEPPQDGPSRLARALIKRFMKLRNETKERYDVGRMAEVFARRAPEDKALFSALCRHVHRHLGVFEPLDFVRFARGLAAAEYRDERVVHALAKWARKRSAEFTTYDWDRFVKSVGSMSVQSRLSLLQRLGPPSGDTGGPDSATAGPAVGAPA